jgi:septum site-determining protein MinC
MDNKGLKINVHVELGNRFLSQDQKEQICDIIAAREELSIDTIESNVISKIEAERILAETEVRSVAKIVRSGQILQVEGDLLLIGDVNPGGTVKAGGNIFVLGSLKGIAHAGYNGNRQAVIAASVMNPTQLRIGNIFNRSPDHFAGDTNDMECAYLDENQKMVIERLQQLAHLRPNLTRLEGGIKIG